MIVDVSLPIARNVMHHLIAADAAMEAATLLGITAVDFEFVTGSVPWTREDRGRVRAVLDAVCHGVVDLLGAPRLNLPAEYMAAVLVTFVKPVNMHLACLWCERQASAEDITEGGSVEAVSADKLFALVCQLVGPNPPGEPKYDKRMKRAVREKTEGER